MVKLIIHVVKKIINTHAKDKNEYVINYWIDTYKKDYVNGITTCPCRPFCKVTFRMFQESAPARSSSILFSPQFSELHPPKSRTPLPSGDSAIALSDSS